MSDEDKLIGLTLAGKYLIKRLLGAGGMGAVYEAQHIGIGKRVAVKVITQTPGAQNEEAEARFRREARAASAVESEHIVQVFDVGQDPAAGLYMVMEYLTGEDLATRLEREKRLDIGSALVIASQTARGLAKAHAAGVVHRDLKPANIFLITREDGSLLIKVLDFGISKLIRDEAEGAAPSGAKLTRMGTVIGTPQYMSPEQAQGLLTVDHRTDVWSLGAVLYECLAGRCAYEELATYEQTIIKIVTTQPAPLVEVAPWVPESVAKVVHRALTQDPAARLPDCGALSRALAEAMPQMFPDASGQFGAMTASRANMLQGSNAGYFGSNPALVGTLPSQGFPSSAGRAVVTPPSSAAVQSARSLTERETMEATVAAMTPAAPGAAVSVAAIAPPGTQRMPSVTTGSGVVVGPKAGNERPQTYAGRASLTEDALEGIDVPGVPRRRRSTGMMILAVFAAASVGGLAVGGVLVARGRSTATASAATSPQGLVVQAPSSPPSPPADAPSAVTRPSAPATLAAQPPPAASPAGVTKAAKPAVAGGHGASRRAPRGAPPPTKTAAAPPAGVAAAQAPAKSAPASGGSFGGVNISDQY